MYKKSRKVLLTRRTITATIFSHEGEIYFRTREIAGILGLKQPFEFTAHIRRTLGDDVIKTGHFTEPFRSEDDKSSTTFVSSKDLKKFLKNFKVEQKFIMRQRQMLLAEIAIF